MILVALGSNQPGPWGEPAATIRHAIAQLDRHPLTLVSASTAIVTKPFGRTDQPDFVNAVANITTALTPDKLLRHLQSIEASAGRKRNLKWGPRTLDLDIIDFNGMIRSGDALHLPHPGIAERHFVLQPIAEMAPHWRHPVNGLTAQQMLDALPA